MRGQNAICSALPSLIKSNPNQKGHRNVHLERRDDALAARFYYHYQLKQKRYEAALLDLEAEFFIVPNVIIQRLALRTDYIKELSKKEIGVSQLRKLFPFYAWN
ncbi:MAG: hypothetical protein JST19_13725 [Bacteroidetes bacterium]|nr:hypothetical protein [Bacteroidota bacterium]